MATDPSLPGELRQAASRVASLRAELARVLVPATAQRSTMFWLWGGPAAANDAASLARRARETARVGEMLDDLAGQLRASAKAVQDRLDEEARQRELAAERAREAEAARRRQEQQR